jgi:2-dehydropantoate 2-reductase
MRFLIVGAGALGGYYGGMLLRGGADVTFLVRAKRAARLAERGLTIKLPEGAFKTPIKTVIAGAAGGPYDIVFLTCKAYDLDGAIDDFAPALSPSGAVLPVLNGINHIAVLSDRLGADRVLGGTTQFLVMQTSEGDIVPTIHGKAQTTFGELTGGGSARCEAILAALAAGGVPCSVSEDIITEMWMKFCGAAASFTIAAVIRARASEVVAAPAGAGFVAATFDECARIVAAAGHPPPAWLREVVIQIWTQPGSNYGPSLLADVENGRPTEGEHVIGDLARRADQLGVQASIVRAALCSVQIYEARRRAGGPSRK